MKKIFARTFKIGKFTFSVFSNEIVIVYVGGTRVYIKTIRMTAPGFGLFRPGSSHSAGKRTGPGEGRPSPLKKPPVRKMQLAAALTLAIAAVIFAFSLYPPDDREGRILAGDELIKQNLLESKQTDYSSPDASKRLVINEHRVSSGESLQKIAKKYGVSVDTIRGTNNLATDSLLHPGMKLKIPNKDGILLRMQKGGELVSIARRYRVSLKKIIEENNFKNADFVAANTVLFIPDAKPLNTFSGFLWPAGRRFVTCGYGWRRSPFEPGRTEFHSGIDIRSNFQYVKASKYGKVTYTGWLGGYGKTVVIAHPGGYKTLYGHLSRIIVRSGQYVKQGQYIAASGNTGRSTGAHLHFEIMRNGKSINPYIYFRKKRR